MSAFPDEPPPRTILPLVLVTISSALVVISVYEIGGRWARHRTEPATCVTALPVAVPAQQAAPFTSPSAESCADLKRRYLAQCPTDHLPTPPPPEPAKSVDAAERESERRAIADADAWLAPPPSELAEMAKRCELRFLMPAVTENSPPTVTDEQSAAMALSKQERALLEKTLNQLHGELYDFATHAVAEGSGKSVNATGLTLEAMLTELQTRPENGFEAARQKLAREQAGLIAPPKAGTPLPPGERLLRRWDAMGDDFERRLADVLGTERAHELRFSPKAVWNNRFSQSGCPSQL